LTDLLKGKTARESEVQMTELVLPQHTNALGTIFGGTVMGWIDIAAAISAMRHARTTVVTASVDTLNFIAPIKLGHIVRVKAVVNYTARTSMEIGVDVESEDPKTGLTHKTVSSFITFVAVDKDGKPVAVPPLLLETDSDRKRFKEGETRRAKRIEQTRSKSP
jgi:acyl-CoA hydrolase